MDIRIHLVLVEKMNFPPFEHAPIITEGIQDLSLGATKFLDLGIVFKCSKDSEKNFIPATMFHRCSKKKLEDIISYGEKSNLTTDAVKFEKTRRIKCIFELGEFWWLIIKFLKHNQGRG